MLEEALKHLEKYEGEIFDHLSVQDTKGDNNYNQFINHLNLKCMLLS